MSEWRSTLSPVTLCMEIHVDVHALSDAHNVDKYCG